MAFTKYIILQLSDRIVRSWNLATSKKLCLLYYENLLMDCREHINS